MKPSSLILLACLTPLVGCAPREISQFMGQNPKQVYQPRHMIDQDTMQFDESKPGVDWGMSLTWQGDHYMVSADQNTTPGQPTQVWQIVALQDIPLLHEGQILVMGDCLDDEVPNSRVVAVADYQSQQTWFDHFAGAWAYDYAQNAFLPYPTAHLRCLNPRAGLGLDLAHTMRVKQLPVIPIPPAITAPVPQPSGG